MTATHVTTQAVIPARLTMATAQRTVTATQRANNTVMNQTLGPGTGPEDELDAVVKAMTAQDPTVSGEITVPNGFPGGVRPRGKVLFGMSRLHLRELGRTTNSRISIQNGVVTVRSLTGYLPGTEVVVNSQTGIIGEPEATQQGITVTTLLNPQIQIGGLLKINNKDINTQNVRTAGGYPNYTGITYVADVSKDGEYVVLIAEHEGDSRGNPFYWLFSMHGQVVINSPDRMKKRIDQVSGITGWTIHDIRRTARSHFSALPVEQHVRELVIAHRQGGIKGVYDLHRCADEKYECLRLWEHRLAGILAPPTSAAGSITTRRGMRMP